MRQGGPNWRQPDPNLPSPKDPATSSNPFLNGSRTLRAGERLYISCGQLSHIKPSCTNLALPLWEQAGLKALVSPPKRLTDQGRNAPPGVVDVQAAQFHFGLLQEETRNSSDPDDFPTVPDFDGEATFDCNSVNLSQGPIPDQDDDVAVRDFVLEQLSGDTPDEDLREGLSAFSSFASALGNATKRQRGPSGRPVATQVDEMDVNSSEDRPHIRANRVPVRPPPRRSATVQPEPPPTAGPAPIAPLLPENAAGPSGA
jgi:hypothetical protein